MAPARKTKAGKTTKKPLAENTDTNESYEDEVHHDAKDDEIAKLQEQIRMLKMENATLRKNIETQKPVATSLTPKARRLNELGTPVRVRRNSTQSMKTKERGCSCSGSCINKKCGCVKKDAACSEFCRCSDSCQNQMDNIDEDKENHGEDKENHGEDNENYDEDNENYDGESTPEERNTTKKEKKVVKKNIKKNKLSTSSSESEVKSPITSTSGKSAGNSSYSSNASTQTDEEGQTTSPQSELNPMKPSRQLERSPLQKPKSSPNSTANTTINATVFHDDDVFLPKPKVEAEDELPPPDEIYQMEVDWEKHQAQLVECRKCKRKFHPYRVKKHEQSCKKI